MRPRPGQTTADKVTRQFPPRGFSQAHFRAEGCGFRDSLGTVTTDPGPCTGPRPTQVTIRLRWPHVTIVNIQPASAPCPGTFTRRRGTSNWDLGGAPSTDSVAFLL